MDYHDSLEPGDHCPQDGCNGTLDFGAPECCSCHISAPCSDCENSGLQCDECGFDTAAAWKEEKRQCDDERAAMRAKTWRDGGTDRTNETTHTRTANPYNSTPFTACCDVASTGDRCPICNAQILWHDDGLDDRRREVGPLACLMCGKPRPRKGQPFGSAGTCVC